MNIAHADRLVAGILAGGVCTGERVHGKYFNAYDYFTEMMDTANRIGVTLNFVSNRFTSIPLKETVFLNCVPKCGTHLLRNMLFMFVPPDQQYHDEFIQAHNWDQHAHVFSDELPRLCWGHLDYRENIASTIKNTRMIILVRDPYAYVTSYVRFLMSGVPSSPIANLIAEKHLSYEAVLPIVIFGNHDEEEYFAGLGTVFSANALAWMRGDRKLVRYEDLVHHISRLETREAEAYFADLLNSCGIGELPSDWRDRIRAGSDRRLSWTARENLTTYADIPEELSNAHKLLVDVAAPGLRQALGYP